MIVRTAALILAAAIVAQAPQPAPDLRTRAMAVLAAALAGGTAPGISAAIVDADGAVTTAVAGVSDRETGRPLEPGDLLLAGSVGKTFAAARAMQLIEAGRLALDDPIAKYFSGDAWFAR